jgi:hypothetical protein
VLVKYSNCKKIFIMAPEGRQSPPPEEQSAAQQQAPPAENPNNLDAGSDKATTDKAKQTLDQLESNPIHPLEKSANEKTGKGSIEHK